MKPTLVILAAGMGSRYGGIKQIEPVGLNDEIILEFSIFDAIRAGFGKVVFVIRRDIQKDFDDHVLPRFSSHIPCEYVFQDMNDLPSGFEIPQGREKPWGTAHAVLAARHVIQEPFAVINADDFYGRDAFTVMGKFLSEQAVDGTDYAMVGYRLKNTVSDNGTVSRGICQVDGNGFLTGMVEHTKLENQPDSVLSHLDNGTTEKFTGDEAVSMNLFGFTPRILPFMMDLFAKFLSEKGGELKSEFYIPVVANEAVATGDSQMKVLRSSAQWFGITYKEDRDAVVASIRQLVTDGQYPEKLW